MKVYLRELEIEDYRSIHRWRTEENYRYTLGNKHFVSAEREKKSIEQKISSNKDIFLAICSGSDDQIVGTLSIIDIDWRNRKVCWGGIIIGEKEHRRKGYAHEAGQLMLEFVFNELGMNRMYSYWHEKNEQSIEMGEKLGFSKEGVLKDYIYKNGEFHNAVLMSLLRKDYKGPADGRD